MFRINIEKYRKPAKSSKHTKRLTGLQKHRLTAILHLNGAVIRVDNEFLLPDYKLAEDIAIKMLEINYDLDNVNRYIAYLQVNGIAIIKQRNLPKLPYMPKPKPQWTRKQISTFRTLPLLAKLKEVELC